MLFLKYFVWNRYVGIWREVLCLKKKRFCDSLLILGWITYAATLCRSYFLYGYHVFCWGIIVLSYYGFVSDSYDVSRAIYGIEDMCCHQWNWASNNPWGYRDPEVVKDSWTNTMRMYNDRSAFTRPQKKWSECASALHISEYIYIYIYRASYSVEQLFLYNNVFGRPQRAILKKQNKKRRY